MRASRMGLVLGYAIACIALGCGDDGAGGGPLPIDGGKGGALGAAGAAGTVAGTSGGAGTTGMSGSGGSAAGRSGAGAGGAGGRISDSDAGRGGRGGRGGMGGGSGGMTGMAGMGAAGGGAGTCAQELRCKLTAPASTGDAHQDCVDRINQFRMNCACLPPLARWTEGEACADMMAEYDSSRPNAHAGFMDNICMGGSAQNECPGWRSNTMIIESCLQSMWDEGPPPTAMCSGQCFQTYGHFINMTSTRATKVACGFFTATGGKIWAVQNFSR